MRYLENVTVYLSGPVEAAQNPESWRNKITPKLDELGMIVYDPLVKPKWMPELSGQTQSGYKHKLASGELTKEEISVNKVTCDVCRALAYSCNIMIVKVDKSIFTVGTWEELKIAKDCNKPVFFISDDKVPSMWLVDMFGLYSKEDLEKTVFSNIDQLIHHLEYIDNGDVKLDPIKWIFKTYRG